MNDRVAILMATLNGGKWIDDQIASILAQSHANWHLFVRDDGSSDSTIEKIRTQMPPGRVTFLDTDGKPTGSPAGNFFAALCSIDSSSFQFVAFADQDDIWSPDKLARALDRMRTTGALAYSSDLVAFANQSHKAWYISKSQAPRDFDYLFQGASAGCTYVLTSVAACLVADRVRKYLGAFPKDRSHDWLIYAICRSHGLSWVLDDSAHIFYRQHAHNAFGAMPNAGGLLTRLKLSRRHWYRDHVKWLAEFLVGSPDEAEILSAVERLTLRDRVRLALRAHQFRRTLRDQWLLAIAFLTGSF